MTDLVTSATVWFAQAKDMALGWLLSPAAWSQFAPLLPACLLVRLIAARREPASLRVLSSQGKGPVARIQKFSLRFLPFMLPLAAEGGKR